MGPSVDMPSFIHRNDQRPRAIVAEPDEKILAATSEILRRERFSVTPCKRGSELLDLCKKLVPSIVMVDAALEGVDLLQIVRILQRLRETKPVRVIAICPKEFSDLQRSSLKSQGAFAILQRPMKRQDIIDTAAAALASSNEERATLSAATAKRPPRAQIVDPNSPLLVRRILCPFHDEPVGFDRFTLRAGKIQSDTSFFDLPIYKAPTGDTLFVNYHALQTMVCPSCLFATTNAEYFKEPLDPASVAYPFTESTRRAIRDTAAFRRHKAGALPNSFATDERTLEQAILAGELAINCSNTLIDASAHTMNIERARMANAHLRNAHLKELLARGAVEIDSDYREALQLFGRAFSTLRGPDIYRMAYQAMALAIYFGEDRTAFQYLSLLQQLDRDAALAEEERKSLLRYLPRCQRAWEDRDLHRALNRTPAISEAA